MVDPTSDLGEEPEDPPDCATCGDAIVADPSHVVETWVEDGSVAMRHFCSEDCRQSF